jgi:hypothetical protein
MKFDNQSNYITIVTILRIFYHSNKMIERALSNIMHLLGKSLLAVHAYTL